MTTTGTLPDRNRELARQINEESRRDRSSPYAGKFVGIANGQVVVVEEDLERALQRLRQIEPEPQKTLCIEASADYETVEEIWRLP